MSIACDFCHAFEERHEDKLFVESPDGRVHICDGCLEIAMAEVAKRKAEDEKSSGALQP